MMTKKKGVWGGLAEPSVKVGSRPALRVSAEDVLLAPILGVRLGRLHLPDQGAAAPFCKDVGNPAGPVVAYAGRPVIAAHIRADAIAPLRQGASLS